MTIAFIGLGVMGEPMCRNLARNQPERVVGYDLAPDALDRLAAVGVSGAKSLADAVRDADTVFLSLPSGREVQAVCDSALALVRPGALVADLGTSPVALTRQLAAAFADRAVCYADAPIARTRQAAEDGTLSIMVGADAAVFARLQPLLACMASDITHCGGVGTGQLAKLMNNMVLIQTVVALSEALAVARRAGMDGETLLQTLSKGSADSFALRNHGLKALVPGMFPDRAFPTAYARKDLRYALELAEQAGLTLRGAELADAILGEAIAAGDADRYWPVIGRVIDRAG